MQTVKSICREPIGPRQERSTAASEDVSNAALTDEPRRNGLGQRRVSTSFRYVMIAVLCCLGIALSVGAFGFTLDGERQRQSEKFDTAARDRAAAIRGKINTHVITLESLAAFYAVDADKEISDREFRTFCAPVLTRA